MPFASSTAGDAGQAAQERPESRGTLIMTGADDVQGAGAIEEGVEAFWFDKGGRDHVLWIGGTSGGAAARVNLGDRPKQVDMWGT